MSDRRAMQNGLYNLPLAQELGDDARLTVRNAVANVLVNAANFPENVQSRLLGQNMGPLIDRVTDAVLAVQLRESKDTND